jgi:hypothetical protein
VDERDAKFNGVEKMDYATLRQMLSAEQLERLQANGKAWLHAKLLPPQMVAVVKIVSPTARCVWLVAAIHPNDRDRLLALCDVADGDPHIRWMSLEAMARATGREPMFAEDVTFRAKGRLGDYADAARLAKRIV